MAALPGAAVIVVMMMVVIVVRMLVAVRVPPRARRQARRRGRGGRSRRPWCRSGCRPARGLARAAEQDHLQAAARVEVDVRGRHDPVEVQVLELGQPLGDRPAWWS